MGEIGIARKEFLYEIDFWEVNRIIRGYRRRHALDHQLLRLCAYSSFYAFRGNEKGLSPREWLPLPYDKEDRSAPISEEEQEDLEKLLESLNSREDSPAR